MAPRTRRGAPAELPADMFDLPDPDAALRAQRAARRVAAAAARQQQQQNAPVAPMIPVAPAPPAPPPLPPQIPQPVPPVAPLPVPPVQSDEEVVVEEEEEQPAPEVVQEGEGEGDQEQGSDDQESEDGDDESESGSSDESQSESESSDEEEESSEEEEEEEEGSQARDPTASEPALTTEVANTLDAIEAGLATETDALDDAQKARAVASAERQMEAIDAAIANSTEAHIASNRDLDADADRYDDAVIQDNAVRRAASLTRRQMAEIEARGLDAQIAALEDLVAQSDRFDKDVIRLEMEAQSIRIQAAALREFAADSDYEAAVVHHENDRRAASLTKRQMDEGEAAAIQAAVVEAIAEEAAAAKVKADKEAADKAKEARRQEAARVALTAGVADWQRHVDAQRVRREEFLQARDDREAAAEAARVAENNENNRRQQQQAILQMEALEDENARRRESEGDRRAREAAAAALPDYDDLEGLEGDDVSAPPSDEQAWARGVLARAKVLEAEEARRAAAEEARSRENEEVLGHNGEPDGGEILEGDGAAGNDDEMAEDNGPRDVRDEVMDDENLDPFQQGLARIAALQTAREERAARSREESAREEEAEMAQAPSTGLENDEDDRMLDDDDLIDYDDLDPELDDIEYEAEDLVGLEQDLAEEERREMEAAERRADEVAREQAAKDEAAREKADQDRITKEKAAKDKEDFDEWNESDKKRVQAAKEEREIEEMLKEADDQDRDDRRKAREKEKAEREGRKQSGGKRGPDPEDEDGSASKKAKTERVLKTTTGENDPDCIDNDSCKTFRDAMDLARFVYDPATKTSAPPGPVEVGSYTDLDTIFMALASVTEAINKTRISAKQPRTYSLFHPRSLTEHDIVGHPVVLTRRSALVPISRNDDPENPHYALIFLLQKEALRRGQDGDFFRMYNYDSNQTSAQDFIQGDAKDTVRKAIIKAGWAGRADAEAEKILGQCLATEPCEQPSDLEWASGIHVILNGWACAFQLHHNKDALLHKTGCYENAANLINLAIRGLVSSRMIISFFECYEYTKADKTPEVVRKGLSFKDSAKFETYNDLNEHILGLVGRLPPQSGGLHHPDSRPPTPTTGSFVDQGLSNDGNDNYSPVELPPALDKFFDGVETDVRTSSLGSAGAVNSKYGKQPDYVYDPDHVSVDSNDSTNDLKAIDLMSDDEDDYDEDGKKLESSGDPPTDDGPRFDWRGQLITPEARPKAAAAKAKKAEEDEARETEQARRAFGPGFGDSGDNGEGDVDDSLFDPDQDFDLEEDDEDNAPYTGAQYGDGPESNEHSPTEGDTAEEAHYSNSSLPGLRDFSTASGSSTTRLPGLALPPNPPPTPYAPTAPSAGFPPAPPMGQQPPPRITIHPPSTTTPATHPAVDRLRNTGDISARPYRSPPSPTNNTQGGHSEPRRRSSLNESRRNRRDSQRDNSTATSPQNNNNNSPSNSQPSSRRNSLNLAVAPDTPPATPTRPDPRTRLDQEEEQDAWAEGFGEPEEDVELAEAMADGYGGTLGPDGRYRFDRAEGWEDPGLDLRGAGEEGPGDDKEE